MRQLRLHEPDEHCVIQHNSSQRKYGLLSYPDEVLLKQHLGNPTCRPGVFRNLGSQTASAAFLFSRSRCSASLTNLSLTTRMPAATSVKLTKANPA